MSSHPDFLTPCAPGRRARSPRLRTALLTLLALQALAFALLCSRQVHQAEIRRTLTQVEQLAFSDCLHYVTGSTIASCKRQFLTQSMR